MNPLYQITLSILILFTSIDLKAQFISKDNSFGNNGILTTKILDNALNLVNGVTLDDEGRILIAGQLYIEASASKLSFVSRFLATGELDLSFGDQGTWKDAIVTRGSIVHDIVYHKEHILISGFINTGVNNQTELFIARLTEDGTLDPAFSDDGIIYTSIQSHILNCGITSVDVLDEDKISVQWYSRYHSSLNGTNYVVRLNWDGSFDNGFDQDGRFLFYPICTSVLVKPLYAQINNGSFAIMGKATQAPYPTLLKFFNSDGSPVQSEPLSYEEIYLPLVIKTDHTGNYYIAFLESDGYSMNLLKLNPEGSRDITFGVNGKASIPFTSKVDIIEDLLFAEDKVILGGSVKNNGYYQSAFCIFNQDGSIDTDFGSGGAVIHPVTEKSFIKGMAYNSSTNELFLCGTAGDPSDPYGALIMKYKTEETITSVKKDKKSQFNIHLNTRSLFINNSGSGNNATVSVSNLEGKNILIESIYLNESGITTLPFSQPLQQGIYVVQLQAENNLVSEKKYIE